MLKKSSSGKGKLEVDVEFIEALAELGLTEITPDQLIHLKVGDTVMLGNDISDPLLIKVQGMPKVKGFPGVSRGLKAIQVTEIIEREG